jgi:two-component system, chemotaxis family, chemotaxis protein CheY
MAIPFCSCGSWATAESYRRAHQRCEYFAEARIGTVAADWRLMAVVLVVNDDRDMLEMYESALASMGHEPVTKAASATGAETVRQVGADALVVDLQAPDEAEFGLRVIQEVRQDPEIRHLPIILATGAANEIDALRERLEAFNVPVLIKPFAIRTLEEQLRAILDRRARDDASNVTL